MFDILHYSLKANQRSRNPQIRPRELFSARRRTPFPIDDFPSSAHADASSKGRGADVTDFAWDLTHISTMSGFRRINLSMRLVLGLLVWSEILKKAARAVFDPRAFLAKVGDGKAVLTFRKNEIVFSQGDVADKVFYIQKGSVKVVVLSEQGKEAVVGIFEPGQFFGEGCLNGGALRISTITALEECVVTAITRTAMLAALRNQSKFSELFTSYLLTRNSRIEADLIDQLFNSSEKRLARLLLLLANFGRDGNLQPIKIDVSQATLAEMIGTTRSRVSFFMNKFRKLGFISYNGKIEVHNSLLNAVLHDTPQIQQD
jgi:CRP-like cAMP-binding protein